MPTLKDLARHLDLSVTQVSRALNDHSDVSQKTKARVREAATRIGYRANVTARKLRSGRSGIVAMIVPGRSETTEIEILMETVMGLSAEFSRRGMQFVLHVLADGEDAVEAQERLLSGGAIDGMIVTDPVRDDPRIDLLTARGVPFVVHGRDRRDPGYAFIDIDHETVGAELAQALLDRGCRRIALVDGPADRPYAEARLSGLRRSLQSAGLPGEPAATLPGLMTDARGEEAARALAAGTADGVIAGNMMLAAGLRRGLPDLPIAAHDDDLLRYTPDRIPGPLSCTRAPLADAWVPLCDALVAAIGGRITAKMLDVRRIDIRD